jgi:integrase
MQGGIMKKMQKKKVEPIRKLKNINLIKMILAEKPLDLAIFIIGINTGLMASELLSLKVDEVKSLNVGDELKINRRGAGKYEKVALNKACIDAIQHLLILKPDRLYLFEGQRQPKTGNKGPITIWSLYHKVKAWCREINLDGNYGANTLRKTWGYHQRATFNVPLAELMRYFRHATKRKTLEYLCLPDEEDEDIFQNEL